MTDSTLHIFYACDDRFVKFTLVSISSMIRNASPKYRYHIHVLHTDIRPETAARVLKLQNENFRISFDSVASYLESVSGTLPLRDYYSNTTYYRLFIAEMFPELKKALYIDSDTIVKGDISELFLYDIESYDLAACHEQAMVQVDGYGTYAEKCVGVDRNAFFNAGMILINCRRFREKKVLEKFVNLLGVYNFRVTQDEDYLNLICKDHVLFLPQIWNTEVFGEIDDPIEDCRILHYIMVSKPWHYEDCRLGEYFWEYAKDTEVCGEIRNILESYTDEERTRDAVSVDNLLALAIEETNRPDNYVNRINAGRNADRVAVTKKIERYEAEGRFSEDVENDVPGRPIRPGEVDFLCKKPINRLRRKMAFSAARKFISDLIDKKQFILKEIRGIEHFANLDSGAIVTCNHFNALDSFAIQMAYEASGHKKRHFHRIIKEANYTAYPGFYGTLMRHCNTLPIPSEPGPKKEFVKATCRLLRDGHFVLVYPEQGMWWNYRKPRPLKTGGFYFAARNNVPVLPCFITMRDSDILDDNGFPVQEYTIHISEPIYPDPERKLGENTERMLERNYAVWKEIYEREYAIPLTYKTNRNTKEGAE